MKRLKLILMILGCLLIVLGIGKLCTPKQWDVVNQVLVFDFTDANLQTYEVSIIVSIKNLEAPGRSITNARNAGITDALFDYSLVLKRDGLIIKNEGLKELKEAINKALEYSAKSNKVVINEISSIKESSSFY